MTRERLTAAIRTGLKRAGVPASIETAEKITDCVELAFEMEQGEDDAPEPPPSRPQPVAAKAAPVHLPTSPSITVAEDTVAVLQKAKAESARPISVATLKRSGGGSPVATDGGEGAEVEHTVPELIGMLERGTQPTIFIEVEAGDEVKKVRLVRNIIAMHGTKEYPGAVKLSYASPEISQSHSIPGGAVVIGLEATAIFYCENPEVDIEAAMLSIHTQAVSLYRPRQRELSSSTPRRLGEFSPDLRMGVNGGDSDK